MLKQIFKRNKQFILLKVSQAQTELQAHKDQEEWMETKDQTDSQVNMQKIIVFL